MSSNELTQGDDLSRAGATALRGASSAGQRIAQACNAEKQSRCGVHSDTSGQNLNDSSGPSRDVEHTRQGKPRVRNICAAKGSFGADCKANVVVMLVGLYLREIGQKRQITWEVPGYTSNTRFAGGRSGMGAAESRFKQVEQRLRCKPRVLVFGPGRKLPSVKGRVTHPAGNICEELRQATPSTRMYEVGPLIISMWSGLAPRKRVVKNALTCSVRQQSCNATTGTTLHPTGILYHLPDHQQPSQTRLEAHDQLRSAALSANDGRSVPLQSVLQIVCPKRPKRRGHRPPLAYLPEWHLVDLQGAKSCQDSRVNPVWGTAKCHLCLLYTSDAADE